MGRVELLAPGGNYSKMMTAFEYGADAVYIGSDAGFGLRSNCDNFTLEETRRAVEYANEHGKKIYVTLNIFPRDTDIERMVQQAEKLYEIGVHGVIVSDLGAFTAIHAKVPDLDIHVSTQANNQMAQTDEQTWQQQLQRQSQQIINQAEAQAQAQAIINSQMTNNNIGEQI
jgi:putative protease